MKIITVLIFLFLPLTLQAQDAVKDSTVYIGWDIPAIEGSKKFEVDTIRTNLIYIHLFGEHFQFLNNSKHISQSDFDILHLTTIREIKEIRKNLVDAEIEKAKKTRTLKVIPRGSFFSKIYFVKPDNEGYCLYEAIWIESIE